MTHGSIEISDLIPAEDMESHPIRLHCTHDGFLHDSVKEFLDLPWTIMRMSRCGLGHFHFLSIFASEFGCHPKMGQESMAQMLGTEKFLERVALILESYEDFERFEDSWKSMIPIQMSKHTLISFLIMQNPKWMTIHKDFMEQGLFDYWNMEPLLMAEVTDERLPRVIITPNFYADEDVYELDIEEEMGYLTDCVNETNEKLTREDAKVKIVDGKIILNPDRMLMNLVWDYMVESREKVKELQAASKAMAEVFELTESKEPMEETE